MAINNDRWRDNLYRDDPDRGWRDWNRAARDRERGPVERGTDEVRSWFGDDEAERRRRMDEARNPYYGPRYSSDPYWSDRERYDRPSEWNREEVYPAYRHGAMGPFTGRGPRGYQRSDARIREDVCDRLTYAPDVDASDIEVHVENNEVVLRGTVNTRDEKRRAEDIAEDIAGVHDVHNEIRVAHPSGHVTSDRGLTELNLTGSNTTPSPIGETPRSSGRPRTS